MSAPATAEPVPRVRVSGIGKSFGGVAAIHAADLAVRPGTVHALVGENGAGKSTLIKIISGAETPDRGVIEFEGRPVTLAGTTDAMALGVATVYQEPQLFAELTVTENIFTGRELRRAGRVDWRRQRDQVDRLLELIGLPSRLATRPVGELSIAVQQQISIAKALAQQASVLILDEPSAILTEAEIDVLFGVIRRLTERGVSVIYISHRLDELFRIADEVTIMRDGRSIGTYPIGELTVRKIAELMVGGAIEERAREHAEQSGEPVLILDRLSGIGFTDVDLQVRPGEIVALYGLVGSGAAEVAATLWGMIKPTAGTITLDGRSVRPRSPRHAQRLGIALLPADRKRQGLFAFQSLAFNITAGHIRRLSRLRLWFDRRQERAIARSMIERLSIRTTGEAQPVGALSGGNAQKTVLARQLIGTPSLLLLSEPTQGVDVGAKEEIHRLVADLADQGAAILIVTADLPEAQRIADRIVVVRDGATIAEFGPDASQVDVLAAASGDDGPDTVAEDPS